MQTTYLHEQKEKLAFDHHPVPAGHAIRSFRDHLRYSGPSFHRRLERSGNNPLLIPFIYSASIESLVVFSF